jgi:hypothetical protein
MSNADAGRRWFQPDLQWRGVTPAHRPEPVVAAPTGGGRTHGRCRGLGRPEDGSSRTADTGPMGRSKLTRTTCKGCKTLGHAHEGAWPKTVTFVVTKRGKVPLGLRMQATGSAMSSGLSGANKGGYVMQAAQGRKPDKGKLVCVVCGSDKIAVETVKVKTDDAVRLLAQNEQ